MQQELAVVEEQLVKTRAKSAELDDSLKTVRNSASDLTPAKDAQVNNLI